MAKTEEVKEILAGRRVLIVEDDEGLTERLGKEFKRFGADEVAIRFTVEGGLKELKEKGSEYDLIVVDAMLPASEESFQRIKGYRGELKECLNVLKEEDSADPGDEEFRKELAKARERWQPLNRAIASLIRKEGGIEMVRQWLEPLKGKRHPPILYLTAIGNPDVKQEGLLAAGERHVDWLTKPVTVETLLDRTEELIAANEKERAAEVGRG
ncbi:MAG: response regulator transcription factor [Planctomycetota bacterium]|jgi:DNA-binding response OmpR family regulator